jgi:hypothetical protein
VEEVDRPNIGGIHVCARCRRSVASHDAHEPGSLSHARSERSGPRRNGRFARGKEHGSPRACVLGGRLYALTAAHANDGGALSWRRGAAHRRGRRRFPAARDRLPALIRARPRRENRPSLMVTPRRRGRPKRTLLQLRLRAFSCSSITCGVPLFGATPREIGDLQAGRRFWHPTGRRRGESRAGRRSIASCESWSFGSPARTRVGVTRGSRVSCGKLGLCVCRQARCAGSC